MAPLLKTRPRVVQPLVLGHVASCCSAQGGILGLHGRLVPLLGLGNGQIF